MTQAADFDINDRSLVPSDEDWRWPNFYLEPDLTQQKFGGKTIAEMMPFVVSADIGAFLYFEDMPPKPWRYYVRAFVELLRLQRNGELDNNSSVAAAMWLGMLEIDLNLNPQRILPVMDDLLPTVEAIAQSPVLYGFDEDESESVAQKCAALRQLYDKVKKERLRR